MATILVIDSDRVFRDILSDVLQVEGYIVISAETGIIGLQKALECLPDLIICDAFLRGMDGYTVLQYLRQNSQTQHIPFIFLSILTGRLEFKKGLELGANHFLTKPIQLDELFVVLKAYLQN